MNRSDELSSCYAELLEGTYDCVDRVVLNAYFPMGQTGGGGYARGGDNSTAATPASITTSCGTWLERFRDGCGPIAPGIRCP
jgi:hypothetical protein